MLPVNFVSSYISLVEDDGDTTERLLITDVRVKSCVFCVWRCWLILQRVETRTPVTLVVAEGGNAGCVDDCCILEKRSRELKPLAARV